MTDFLEELLAIAEQELGSSSTDKKIDLLAGLSAKEIRRRFDENGEPREGFDIDGNPTKENEDEPKPGNKESSRQTREIGNKIVKRRAR